MCGVPKINSFASGFAPLGSRLAPSECHAAPKVTKRFDVKLARPLQGGDELLQRGQDIVIAVDRALRQRRRGASRG